MKFTFNWLKDYLETDKTLTEITDKLSAIGLEVEEVQDKTESLKDFVIAEIKEVKEHPDSDHLHILAVDDGSGKILQIVCGAPNVRVGLKGVLAHIGVKIPYTGDTLKASKIRGVESQGMMCSGRELGLSEEHNGILDLQTETANGTPLIQAFDFDPVVDINVTPNRPDAFGVLGIAKDLAAAGMGKFTDTQYEKAKDLKGSFESPIKVTVAESGCRTFAGCYIRGVKNGQSPLWLQERLKAVGLRPISALVDVTNFLNIGRCRPLHVFDADKLHGNITARFAKEGELITTLDEKQHTLASDMTVIADDSRALSVAGIMGGEDTGVSDGTVNVFLESAYFEPMNIAKTGRTLNIESDSRTRFERGIDSASCLPDLKIAANMILELCGGKASFPEVAGQIEPELKTIPLRYERIEKLCGVAVPKEEADRILNALGFKQNGNNFTVPSWRPDVEGEADLVEEVMRIYGYDKLPALSVCEAALPTVALSNDQRKEIDVRRAMAAKGGNQIITWSFMDSKIAKHFGGKGILINNPIASDLNEMRPSLLPNLIAAAVRNAAKGYPDVSLFEVGPVFNGNNPTEQETVAAMIRAGKNHAEHWAEKAKNFDVFSAKADALAALAAVNAPVANLQAVRNAPSYYHPGRSGALTMGKVVLAYFGEIHPSILKLLGSDEPIVACEIFLNKVPAKRAKSKNQGKLNMSSLQPVSRDFAFVADKECEAAKLIKAVKGVDKEMITDVNIFDVYEGANLLGKKSVAVKVTFQPKEKTLTDDDLENLSTRIISAVREQTGAELRA